MNDGSDGTMQDEAGEIARDWVVRLASGDVDAEDLRRFRSWLAASPAHASAFERERAFWGSLGGLRHAAPREAGEASLPSRRRQRFGRRGLLAGGLAAACVAVVAVTGTDVAVRLRADHRTAVGEQASVALPDGSTAYLNTDSAIAVAYGVDVRRIELLQGEVLFDVVADPARAFRVEAAGGVTQALGTAFVVRADDDAAVVTVTSGTVGVTSPAGAAGDAATVRAGRGERTSYGRGLPPMRVRPADVQAAAAWRGGVIAIHDLPLDAALAELDRYRPGRIVLLDGGPYNRVSGAFDLDNVDAAVAGLAATHGLRVVEVTPYLLFLR